MKVWKYVGNAERCCRDDELNNEKKYVIVVKSKHGDCSVKLILFLWLCVCVCECICRVLFLCVCECVFVCLFPFEGLRANIFCLSIFSVIRGGRNFHIRPHLIRGYHPHLNLYSRIMSADKVADRQQKKRISIISEWMDIQIWSPALSEFDLILHTLFTWD